MSAAPNQLKIIPFARLLAVVFAMLGILAGLIYSVGGLIYDLTSTGTLNPGTALAFLAVIGMPVLFALAGWIMGVLGGALINKLPTQVRLSLLTSDLLER